MSDQELLATLKEMREACAAMARVIAQRDETLLELQTELSRLGIPDGFGVRAEAAIAEVADLTARLQTAERALSLARRATNGWACYAKRDIEHREIAELHREISEVADSWRAGLEPRQ